MLAPIFVAVVVFKVANAIDMGPTYGMDYAGWLHRLSSPLQDTLSPPFI